MERTRGWIATCAESPRAPTRCSCPRSHADLEQVAPLVRSCGSRPALLGGGGRRGRRAPARHRDRGRWTSSASSGWAVSGADRSRLEGDRRVRGARHRPGTSSAAGCPARPTRSSVAPRRGGRRPRRLRRFPVGWSACRARRSSTCRKGGVRDAEGAPTDPRRRAHAVGAVTYRLAGIESDVRRVSRSAARRSARSRP